MDDLYHHLAGMQTFYNFSTDSSLRNIFDKLLDDVIIDIGFKQSLAHIVHRIRDVGLGNTAATRKIAKYAI